MFTGIIEQMGELVALESKNDNLYLHVRSVLAPTLKIDQSLAHEGICLTVTHIEHDIHTVCAVPETIQKTCIGTWIPGRKLNLERCMLMNGRLDGHIVQGHVDTVGTCVKRLEEAGAWRFVFEFDPSFAHLIIEKGSICINGVSLTCFHVGPNQFEVTIIPYTFEHTSFQFLQTGQLVNLEFDVLGKYIARFQDLNRLPRH